MPLLRRSIGAFAFASLVLVACNAINGVGDLTIDEVPSALPPSRTTSDGAPPNADDGGTIADASTADADSGPIATGTCTCAPAPPQGWDGPVVLGESQQGPGPPCDVGLVTAYRGGIAPSPAPPCTACTCGAASVGARCDTTLTLWNSANCGAGTQCSSVQLSGTTCAQITYCNGGSLTSAMKTSLSAVGTCGAPSGGTKTTVAFAREATACSLANVPAGACGTGEACAPTASAGNATCIHQLGQVACPTSGPYTVQKVFFGGMDDGRTCSACTCSPSCTGGITRVYSESACTTSLDTTGPNACDSLPANSLNGSAKVSTVPTFSCSASGGAVSGAVTGKDPTTFCCLP